MLNVNKVDIIFKIDTSCSISNQLTGYEFATIAVCHQKSLILDTLQATGKKLYIAIYKWYIENKIKFINEVMAILPKSSTVGSDSCKNIYDTFYDELYRKIESINNIEIIDSEIYYGNKFTVRDFFLIIILVIIVITYIYIYMELCESKYLVQAYCIAILYHIISIYMIIGFYPFRNILMNYEYMNKIEFINDNIIYINF